MKANRKIALVLKGLTASLALAVIANGAPASAGVLTLVSDSMTGGAGQVALDGFYYETADGRVTIPVADEQASRRFNREFMMNDGRRILLTVRRSGSDFQVQLASKPDDGIVKWGVSIRASESEYLTGVMERVVDGPQQASWAPGIQEAMNLRGQKVDMILKPTTSVYAPYFLSSRGYAVLVQGNWPGVFDFCRNDSERIALEFEGTSFGLKVYTASTPAELVKAHALDAGPPVLPPKWAFTPWRWRDEHRQRDTYYDGTPVTGPFNSEAMEDLLMMREFGIPCGVYWIDRPWGPGRLGYDDFDIDENRLPHFREMIEWLNEQDIEMVLWIGPFFQGQMKTNALDLGYGLAGQRPTQNNYPLADFTNPKARKYWQDGVAKLLKMGVAGFKLDRAEEDIPESGPYRVFDGRSIREIRNVYPVMYVQAAYEIARKYRGNDFVCMPRAAFHGSSKYGVFWGGDIGGTPEGLRASMIALQRSAIMGYPVWGSDTCGYNQQTMDTEMCSRWLGFSCFSPIMEVGPTRNVAFWNFHNPPAYDATLIATWRFYARLHQHLADYSYAAAVEAHKTGMPITRPLFLADPNAASAWSNWWTYLYGPDILVSPLWQKGQRTQEVYLPSGCRWKDAWNPGRVYEGGQTLTVAAELHQVPIFIRAGSKVDLGNLRQEWNDSWAIAQTKPNLKFLDADLRAWFDKNHR